METLSRHHQQRRIDAPLARLASVEPRAARAAVAALDIVLAGIGASAWPEVAWRASALTDDGFPVEFAWSSRDAAIRWTAEVAGPDVPESERLALANAALAQFGGSAAPVTHAASEAPLRFGAWLGGRHGNDASRYKLYIERPDLDPSTLSLLGDLEAALSKRIEWRMLGCDGRDGMREYYGRVRRVGLAEIGLALDWAAIDARAELLAGVAVLARRHRHELPLGRLAGISVAIADGRPVALTWFAFARTVAATTAGVVSAVRAVAEICRGDCRLLSALAGDGEDALGRIGMLGLGAARSGETWVQATWRPEALDSI